MQFWQWLGLAAAAAVMCMVLRRWQPDLAGVLAVVAGGILLLGALEGMEGLRGLLERIGALGGLHTDYLTTLMKVLGMSYATEMTAQTCEDLGEKGLAQKVDMAGRLCIFGVVAPMLAELLETIVALVP